MRVLVIGGSSFVGRALVDAALTAGHEVTLFNRGKTDPGAFPEAEHLVGDRDTDLSVLGGRQWDATVDVCGYVPRQVRSLLETLGGHSGHYTFVSTISVYPPGTPEGFAEDSPLREPAYDDEMDWQKYGELKVGCERVAADLAGDRLLVIRPGYVVGPHDPTHRFTYWVERVAEGHSPMAAPDAHQPLQCVDARDLAAFTLGRIEAGAVDAFHVTTPQTPPTFTQVLETVARGVGTPLPQLRHVGAHDGLPLSAPPPYWSLMTADISRALAAGLRWRPLEETVADTLAWVRAARADGGYVARPGVGLSADDEARLLSGQ